MNLKQFITEPKKYSELLSSDMLLEIGTLIDIFKMRPSTNMSTRCFPRSLSMSKSSLKEA
jgi:DNA-binding transcriptional regulator YiaG